jgi:hypothetical protein
MKNTILLFYKKRQRDRFFRGDKVIRRVLRPVYVKLHKRQKLSGFDVSFRLMAEALRRAGFDVRVNDYATARRHPHHPVGLVGDTSVLEGWNLPNPAVLGPSLYDHPGLAPDLMKDPRFKTYLVLADWMRDMFAPVYGEACASWFAGIDTSAWEDSRGAAKDIDVLIYNKIRWDKYVLVPKFLQPIRTKIAARQLRSVEIVYQQHDHDTYRNLLKRSRLMLFICEHETQGLAYQEALAANVPVLAWEFGMWADPLWKIFSDKPIPASSVPFFSPACGEKFRTLADFDEALDRCLTRENLYEPRHYIEANLSQARSAEIYAREYFQLAK